MSVTPFIIGDVLDRETHALFSSFEDLPRAFYGIDTSKFGMSSNFSSSSSNPSLNNSSNSTHYSLSTNPTPLTPFNRLITIAKDTSVPFEDRCQAIHYLQRIPKINKYEEIIEAVKTIVEDERYLIEKRYHFLFNNDGKVKLDHELVNFFHLYIYDNSDRLKVPTIYKIISAQFLLQTTDKNKGEVQEFLLSIANNRTLTLQLRVEACDILINYGYVVNDNLVNYKLEGMRVLNSLSYSLPEKSSKPMLLTVYNNMQNVHNSTIQGSALKFLELLERETSHKIHEYNADIMLYNIRLFIAENEQLSDRVLNREELHSIVQDGLDNLSPNEFSQLVENKKVFIPLCQKAIYSKVEKAFERITIDSAMFNGRLLIDILIMVYIKVQEFKQLDKMEEYNELMIRMIQELIDAVDTCMTGFCTRILNILSGYVEVLVTIISFAEQLKNNINGRMHVLLENETTEEEFSNIQLEMIHESKSLKPMIQAFLDRVNSKLFDELRGEFVECKERYMSIEEFDLVYRLTISKYFGL